jgi:Uma2 family endonuclease
MALIVSPEALRRLDDEAAFLEFCARHSEWRLERDPAGALVIMPPIGGLGGHREVRPLAALDRWNDEAGQPGLVFSSQTMFRLPGGGWRSPDAAWVSRERWNALTRPQQIGFPPIAPDFLIEILSPSDRRSDLLAKMDEYMRSGVRLAWLLDPEETRTARVYRAGRPPEEGPLSRPLSGEDVLPGFAFRWEEEPIS